MLDRCSEERRPHWAGVLFCLVVVSGYRSGIEVLLAAREPFDMLHDLAHGFTG